MKGNLIQLKVSHRMRPLFSMVPEALIDLASTVINPVNSTATLLNLVSLGDNLPREFDVSQGPQLLVPKTWVRVPGCLSEVYVGVVVDEDGKVKIEGKADSRIARGLFALVSKVVASFP